MKCFYHPDKDAVGTCSQCGKGACRSCIEDIGGALLCSGCRDLAQAQAKADEKATVETSVAEARKKLRRSWIVTAAVSIFVIVPFAKDVPGIASFAVFLFGVYAVWATYWGATLIWPWWRNFLAKMGCFVIANPITWVFLLVSFFTIPIISAYLYGVLGGGIMQFLKWRRLAQAGVPQ